jgi:hypothetical protein
MGDRRPLPSIRPGEPPDGLAETLITVAGLPDDAPEIEDHFITIIRLTADLVAPVSYASITATRDGAPTTVASSNDTALAVDLAQYADQAGPCLDALRASLSIPVFAGSGVPVAALNLYGRDPASMAALTHRVLATYEADSGDDNRYGERLDPGSEQLIAGIAGGFRVRAIIQRALGQEMAARQQTAEAAYLALCARATDTGTTLVDAARTLLREQSR